MSFWHILAMIFAVILVLAVLGWCFPYPAVRVWIFILRHTIYVIDAHNLDKIPKRGPVLLVANHVSPFDGLIMMGLTSRKVHFMMHQHFYQNIFFRRIFKRLGIVEVPSIGQAKKMQSFLENIKEILRRGEVVCVFPEGGVSENGLISHFKKGIRQMVPDELQVPIIPVRVGMIRGSLFTICDGKVKFVLPNCFPIPISVSIGDPIPDDMTPYQLRQKISEMGAEIEAQPYKGERPVHYFFLLRTMLNPHGYTYKDYNKKPVSNFSMLLRGLLLSKIIRRLYEQKLAESGEVSADKVKDLVGVLLPNCTNLAALTYGVLFADKTPAVLNFSSGGETIKKIIKNSEIKLVLTSKLFIEKLNIERTPEMVLLEDVAPTIGKWEKIKTLLSILLLPASVIMKLYSPESKRDLNRILVVLFSSGSTGNPKGIMLTHHNINSNIQSFWRTINWTPKDHIIGNLPLFHAYGFMVNFAFPAVSGTKVSYVVNPLDASAVCNVAEQDKCTMMMATPTFLQNYMRKYHSGQFKTLRLVVTGAEKLRHDISAKFNSMTGLEIVEGFGCTELSPIVSINLSQSFFKLGKEYGKRGSIGAPLPGIHVKIVDPESGIELPENTPGLMLVKGGLVMKGYLNEPEATARVMENDYYKTGDIAAMSSDGYLTITGRLSRFSKIAGEMVPHELVEMAVNEILQCEDRVVAVSSRSDEKRGERLVVFYSTNELEPEKMVEKLREKDLPNLWIPKADDFVKIEKIPLLGAGKIDLQQLKKMAEKL